MIFFTGVKYGLHGLLQQSCAIKRRYFNLKLYIYIHEFINLVTLLLHSNYLALPGDCYLNIKFSI